MLTIIIIIIIIMSKKNAFFVFVHDENGGTFSWQT